MKEKLTEQQKWQDFNHELAHVLFHVGSQHKMTDSFRKYQEYKANNFMNHAFVPTFMLDNLKINDYTHKTILNFQQF